MVLATKRKLSARTLRVLTLGPKGMYGDHAESCADPIGCDPAGLPSSTCDVGEALHRVANRPQKPVFQLWIDRLGKTVRPKR